MSGNDDPVGCGCRKGVVDPRPLLAGLRGGAGAGRGQPPHRKVRQTRQDDRVDEHKLNTHRCARDLDSLQRWECELNKLKQSTQ